MRRLSDPEISRLDYGDAHLVSLTWRGEAEEPMFVVTLRRQDRGKERTIALAFTWPEVDIAINSRRSFTPLSFEGRDGRTCQRLEDGRWRITLDFASQGAIHVTCTGVYRDETQ